MDKYIVELLHNLNEEIIDEKSVKRIKNLICYLSENKHNFENAKLAYLNEILYNAAIKIRTFGYNKMNKLESLEDSNNLKEDIKNLAIKEFYQSKVSNDIILDKRQKDLVYDFNEKNRLFLSAPTSFGKTFILREIILKNIERYSNIAIILPTVALLQEVSEDMGKFCRDNNLDYKVISTIYTSVEEDKNILIFTPERMVQFFAINKEAHIDFFFFDEIYKMDEDIACSDEEESSLSSKRVYAFRIALYLLLKQDCDFYLAGPFIDMSNIKYGLRRLIQKYNVRTKEISFEPTMKNKWYFEAKKLTIISDIEGETYYTFQSKMERKDKLIYLKERLQIGPNNQTIFFVSKPAYTYKYALEYSKIVNNEVEDNYRLYSFIDHINNNYCYKKEYKEWSFLKALQSGIGVHNGKMPKYFQKEIMFLFNKKIINSLFCTSTIIEGVNSNAKNIILLSTPQGESEECKKFTLLNINGRAGRYMRHFIGNVIYTNPRHKEIEENDSFSLDFKTFSKNSLSDLDLENVNIADLEDELTQSKINLERSFNKDLLDDETFFENRLIERKKQEKILKELIKKEEFDKFLYLLRDNSLNKFLYNKTLKDIFNVWVSTEELEKKLMKKYNLVIFQYTVNGYSGLINSYVSYNENKNKSIDSIMGQAFSDVKSIIEFEVPKILNLFQSLYNRALSMKNYQQKIDISRIIRYFELGVKSELGTDMVEKGIPYVTIRKIEERLIEELINDLYEEQCLFIKYYNNQMKRAIFDNYERILIEDYIDKYCN